MKNRCKGGIYMGTFLKVLVATGKVAGVILDIFFNKKD